MNRKQLILILLPINVCVMFLIAALFDVITLNKYINQRKNTQNNSNLFHNIDIHLYNVYCVVYHTQFPDCLRKDQFNVS